MATKQQTVDYILEQLQPLDVAARKMFGEYALYIDAKTTAFICDDTLFVKILPANAEHGTGLSRGPAYPGSKDYYIVDGDRLEDTAWLKGFLQRTADAVPAKKPK